MLATYERKKVTEYTSFNYEFKVFYKDEYVCDLLKIGRHEWAFSAFQSCDKLEGLQMFLYNKTSWETFKKKRRSNPAFRKRSRRLRVWRTVSLINPRTIRNFLIVHINKSPALFS